jgi:hypothetical protein
MVRLQDAIAANDAVDAFDIADPRWRKAVEHASATLLAYLRWAYPEGLA